MRTFSYILIALVTVFVLNIALSFSLPAYRNAFVNVRSTLFPFSKKAPSQDLAEVKQSENTRLAESLDRIDKHIESLSDAKKTGTGTIALNGATATGTVSASSGSVIPQEEAPKEPDIPLSGIFLQKIMPDIMPKKIENKGFFGIQVMGKILYNTYLDEHKRVKIYTFNETYDTLLINMKLTGSVYTLNETDQFFGYTFFLNPVKKDPKDKTVRFITAIEGRAVGVEVPKNYYSTFKKMLLTNK